MNVTVILCTYNRCESLMRALRSVALSRLPESVAWEVLVVDNNSSDQTRDAVADFSTSISWPTSLCVRIAARKISRSQ